MYKVESYNSHFEGDSGLVCGQIHKRFKEYVVKTTDKEVKDAIGRAEKEDKVKVTYIFKLTYENITKYTDEELNQHYEKNTKEWQDWCNDVLLFFTHRYVLFGSKFPIPLIRI